MKNAGLTIGMCAIGLGLASIGFGLASSGFDLNGNQANAASEASGEDFVQAGDLKWRWVPLSGGDHFFLGCLMVGGIPPGNRVRIECHDPVVGPLMISGNREEDVHPLVIDPAKANWRIQSESGGSLNLRIRTPGFVPPPQGWFRVTLLEP